MTEDVPFYVELARETEGPLVELAVGNGRVAIPSRARPGGRCSGSTSRPSCWRRHASARLRRRSSSSSAWRTCATSSWTSRPAWSTSPSAALLHLPTWADRVRVFERVHAALRPGGRFAWNAFVFDPHIAARVDGEWQEQNGIRHRIDQFKHDNRIDITLESGDAISLWWLTRSEWEGLIDVAGFEVEALYGGFERQPFDENATEFVWVVRKPV